MSKYKLVFVLFFLLHATALFAQVDSIYSRKFFFDKVYFQNKKLLSVYDLHKIIKSNPEAEREYKMSKSNFGAATFFLLLGGCSLAWGIATVQPGVKTNWFMLLAGVAGIGLSIPFDIQQKKHKLNAVEIFNKGLRDPKK